MLVLKIVAVALVLILASTVIWSLWISRPLFNETRDHTLIPSLANPAEALTFARTKDALIRVTAFDGSSVTGVNLTASLGADRTSDLIELYAALGYDAIAGAEGPRTTAPVSALVSPVNYVAPFIAAGTNYAEHAEEVLLDDPPFLFPKLAAPTNWNADVRYVPRLDYEAELGMVPLSDISGPDAKVEYGLVLCNDFTDRWTLVRELRLREPMGTTGFASAKGKETFLPCGALFAIPRTQDFHRGIELRLYVNDALRQRFRAGDMILKIEEIVAKSFALQNQKFWRGEEPVQLMPHGKIPRGTLILTGTAAGVAFKPPNIWAQWLYLARGDVVRTEADGLGHLSNEVR